jgi:hypothetical protein
MKASSGAAEKTLFLIAFLAAVWQLVHISTAPLSLITQYLPDDTFYYLEIARNLAMRGISSVDGGQTITTGYHLLWAWICVGIARLAGFDRMILLRGMIVTSGLLALGTVFATAVFAWRRSLTLLSVLTLAITSFSFLYNSVSAMEWSLVIVFSTATAFALASTEKSTRPGLLLAGLFVLGFLGSLSRSDFGGQTACYLGAAIVVWVIRGERRYFLPSLSALLGASVGLAVTFYRDYLLTGSIVQGSARMKSIWSKVGGHSPLPFIPMLVRSMIYDLIHRPKLIQHSVASLNKGPQTQGAHFSGPATTIGILLVLALFVAAWIAICLRMGRKSEGMQVPSLNLFLLLSAGLTILLYATVDIFNSFALQIWYSAQITVALVILLYFLAKGVADSGHRGWAHGVLALITISNLVCFALSKPKYGPQARMLTIAPAIKQLAGDARVGIPDSGIFNFAYGGTAINLDGLVNNEIVNYAPDRLPCYLLDKKIVYFTNFGQTAEIALHLRPYTDYASEQTLALPDNDSVIVHQLNEAKIRALPECAAH